MLVLYVIWISSTETIGGGSSGYLSITGRLGMVNKTKTEWKVIE